MSLLIEMVADGRMNGGELLQTSHAPEPLHGPFSSSKRQVRILRTIVQPAASFLLVGIAYTLQCRSIGPELVGHQYMRATFDDIDILAGKGYEIDPWIDDAEIEVEALLSETLVVRFSGVAHVTLHYGSKHDAAEVQHDFPFWLRFEAPIEKPAKLALIGHRFDDTSWHS